MLPETELPDFSDEFLAIQKQLRGCEDDLVDKIEAALIDAIFSKGMYTESAYTMIEIAVMRLCEKLYDKQAFVTLKVDVLTIPPYRN